MEMSTRTKFGLAIGLQLVIISSIIIFKLLILAGGTELLLPIKPVDPRDWLRGDYALFTYDISEFATELLKEKKLQQGDSVYVTSPDGFYQTNVLKQKPTAENVIFIKGKVENVNSEKVIISYGIEQYFIPEGKGQDINFQGKKCFAKVVVDKNGNAVLKQIYVDGALWP